LRTKRLIRPFVPHQSGTSLKNSDTPSGVTTEGQWGHNSPGA